MSYRRIEKVKYLFLAENKYFISSNRLKLVNDEDLLFYIVEYLEVYNVFSKNLIFILLSKINRHVFCHSFLTDFLAYIIENKSERNYDLDSIEIEIFAFFFSKTQLLTDFVKEKIENKINLYYRELADHLY
jgi:hypothetical protein